MGETSRKKVDIHPKMSKKNVKCVFIVVMHLATPS